MKAEFFLTKSYKAKKVKIIISETNVAIFENVDYKKNRQLLSDKC